MRFGSVCSGIEAASVAWHPLGWQAAWFSEIESFPCAVLAHHHPGVPNLGDMTTLPARIRAGEVEAPDLLCGGTPCQAFSVAGLRRSLDDARGNLSLTFCEIADAIDAARSVRRQPPSIIFWENVPGVLSTKDNAFGCFLAGLAGDDEPAQAPGGKWKVSGVVVGPERLAVWRVLDAQYFGVAQRRRRVFVLGVSLRHPRAWAIAEALLPLQQGVRGHPPSRAEARQGTAAGAAAGAGVGQPYAVANCLTQRMHKGINTTLDEGQTPVLAELVPPVAGAMSAAGGTVKKHGHGWGQQDRENGYCVPVAFAAIAPTLSVGHHGAAGHPHRQLGNETAVVGVAHAFDARQSDVIQYGDKTGPLDTDGHTVGVLAYDDRNQAANSHTHHTLRSEGLGSRVSDAVMTPVGVTLHGTDGTQSVASLTDLSSSSLLARIPSGVENSTTTAVMQPVAFDTYNQAVNAHTSQTIKSPQGAAQESVGTVLQDMQVRRLTPRECERLQGFPDDYTAIPWRNKPASECPDGPRYKALGNSWAVPVVRWIGSRIDARLKETTT